MGPVVVVWDPFFPLPLMRRDRSVVVLSLVLNGADHTDRSLHFPPHSADERKEHT